VTTDWLAGLSYLRIVFRADVETEMLPVIHFPAPPMVVLQEGFWKPFVQSKMLGAALTARVITLRVRRERILYVILIIENLKWKVWEGKQEKREVRGNTEMFIIRSLHKHHHFYLEYHHTFPQP
jgi:hypothetical protein